jgi:hypothetical protein
VLPLLIYEREGLGYSHRNFPKVSNLLRANFWGSGGGKNGVKAAGIKFTVYTHFYTQM